MLVEKRRPRMGKGWRATSRWRHQGNESGCGYDCAGTRRPAHGQGDGEVAFEPIYKSWTKFQKISNEKGTYRLRRESINKIMSRKLGCGITVQNIKYNPDNFDMFLINPQSMLKHVIVK